MIVENHQIAHINVVSKYYRFYPGEIDIAIKDFQSILEKLDYHPDGRMLFSILNDPASKVMNAEIFLPIKEATEGSAGTVLMLPLDSGSGGEISDWRIL